MMRATRIEIEGMHQVDSAVYDLQNLTYLHGLNGAGKSTIMQAIQLALLGYIPGYHKTAKDAVFQHASKRLMSVKLHLVDGDTSIVVTRGWSGMSGQVTSFAEIQPEGYPLADIIAELELPIFNFNEFNNMTGNKLKEWFIQFLPSVDYDIDWNTLLTDTARSAGVDISENGVDVPAVVDEIDAMPATGVDLIRAVHEKFKSIVSFKKSEVKRIENSIQSLIFYDDFDSDLTASELDEKITYYENLQKSIDRAEQVKKSNERLERQLEAYSDCSASSAQEDEEYIKLSAQLYDVQLQIETLTISVESDNNKLTELRNTKAEYQRNQASLQSENSTKQNIIDSKGICPYTSQQCDSIHPLFAQYRAEIEANEDKILTIQEDISKVDSEISQIENNEATILNQIDQLHKQEHSCASALQDIMHKYEIKHKLSQEIQIVPEIDVTENISEALEELRTQKIKIAANERYHSLIDTITQEKFKVDQELKAYESWVKLTGVNGLQSSTEFANPFADLQSSMDKYIPVIFGEDVACKFNLSTKANSFSYGIAKDGQYIPFNLLSSGEKCLYTLALLICLVDRSHSPLKLIMIDDLLDHLDNVNIVKLFDSLKSLDNIQFIFAGVKDVEGDFITEVERK